MLDERIERYNEIADSKGLFFVWQSISRGVVSINSLTQLRFHHPGKLCLKIVPAILLLEEMGYISVDGDNIKVISDLTRYNDEKEFALHFSDIYVDYLVREDVILLESLKYDSQEDCFILPRNGIKYKHAPYRNLLQSLGILTERGDGFFIFERKIETIIEMAPSKNKKKSEERLLQELERQRIEGLAGEAFVIKYEQTRLNGHPNISKIKQVSIVDVTAGYDIISYDNISSPKLNRFIEVKTYKGKPHFHWSTNEIRVSQIRADHYYIYLVDYDQIMKQDYKPIIIKNPSDYFKNNENWNITPESYLYEHI